MADQRQLFRREAVGDVNRDSVDGPGERVPDRFFDELKGLRPAPEPARLPAQSDVPEDVYANADHLRRTANYEIEDFREPHGFEASPIDHYVCLTCGRDESDEAIHPEEWDEDEELSV